MDPRKLFQVLVIGGALLGAGCEDDATEPFSVDDAGETPADATAPRDSGSTGDAAARADASALADAAARADSAAGDASPAGGDAGDLVECGFCPNDCCVDDGVGGQKARDGFVCCWGTSC